MTDPKTKLVQSQIGTDPAHGSVPPPLYMSSTYLWPNPSEKGAYDYGRYLCVHNLSLIHI